MVAMMQYVSKGAGVTFVKLLGKFHEQKKR